MTVHESIKTSLLARLHAMRVGDRFASEPELCREFGVARMTVNKVVTELTREGLLVRQRGKGSFVAEAQKTRREIVFMLPCSGFLEWQLSSAVLLRRIASGVMEEALNHDCRVEFMAISPSNQQSDIDFAMLDRLTRESLVVLPSSWFYPIFSHLARIGCRVAIIDRQTLNGVPNHHYATAFHRIECDVRGTFGNMVRQLYRNGSRRIALVTHPEMFGFPRHEGYAEAVRELGLPELILTRTPNRILNADDIVASSPLSDENKKALHDFSCDGLIFDAQSVSRMSGKTFEEALQIPHKIPMLLYHYKPELNLIDDVPGYYEFIDSELGREAVRMLLFEKEPQYRIIQSNLSTDKGAL